MKRFLTTLLALACALSLTACQGEESPAPDYELADAQAMVEAGAFSEELEELDADTAFALYKLADYGLKREDLTEAAVLRSAGATCEEVAVLVIGGEGKEPVIQTEQALKDYIQGQIDTNVDYRPAEIPKLENAVIDVRFRVVLLLVANDYEAAKGVTE